MSRWTCGFKTKVVEKRLISDMGLERECFYFRIVDSVKPVLVLVLVLVLEMCVCWIGNDWNGGAEE